MISVVIPSLDAAAGLSATLRGLLTAAREGLIREVILADGGSRDATRHIAEDAGAVVIDAPRGRGSQLAAGAAAARGDWLLFLHADTVLETGWEAEARRFLAGTGAGSSGEAAGYFQFQLDDRGPMPRLLETVVRLRCALLALPYGDQGLLISKRLYAETGGYEPLPLMEDVDLVRRLGRRRLRALSARAVTSAARYRRDGYGARMLRNAGCLALYYLGVPPSRIARLYA